MIGHLIGKSIALARDAIARPLARLGTDPNAISIAGMLLTVSASACYAASCPLRPAWSLAPQGEANAWLLLALALLLLSCACDMLDGAVARLGSRKTPQ